MVGAGGGMIRSVPQGSRQSLFFAPGHEPAQRHEYQFNLDSDEGRQTLAAMLAFLQAHVPSPLASPTGASSSG